MKNVLIRYVLTLAMILVPLLMVADDAVLHRVVFRSGRVMVGEIVMRSDEVVIVKDQRGARFQFPMSDIQEIIELRSDEPEPEVQEAESTKGSRAMTNVKRTSLGFRLVGGVAGLGGVTGAAVGGDFRLGANNVARKQIFLGGQVGYRALIAEGKVLSVMPIDVAMELPLLQGVHVPMVGASIGYGVGIGGPRGGVNAGLSLGYRYHFSRTGALHLALAAEVQQFAKSSYKVSLPTGDTFTSTEGRTAVMGMLSLGVLF